jgi:hypothetical protein
LRPSLTTGLLFRRGAQVKFIGVPREQAQCQSPWLHLIRLLVCFGSGLCFEANGVVIYRSCRFSCLSFVNRFVQANGFTMNPTERLSLQSEYS